MSKRLIKSFVKRTNKSPEEVQKKWDDSKLFLEELEIKPNNPSYYAILIKTFKSKLHLKEEYEFLEKFKKLL